MGQKRKIGLFDSGHGGLSLARVLLSELEDIELFYLADGDHLPYGPKDPEFILKRSRLMTEELISKGVECIIVGCNSATAHAIDQLRKEYSLPLVGVEPFINIINIEPEEGEVLVLTTEATSTSERFEKLKEKCDPKGELTYAVAPGLASAIEDFILRKISNDDFDQFLSDLKEVLPKGQFGRIILGCTHYPLVGAKIEEILGGKTVCPAFSVIQQVKRIANLRLNKSPIDGKSSNFHYCYALGKGWTSRQLKEFRLL